MVWGERVMWAPTLAPLELGLLAAFGAGLALLAAALVFLGAAALPGAGLRAAVLALALGATAFFAVRGFGLFFARLLAIVFSVRGREHATDFLLSKGS